MKMYGGAKIYFSKSKGGVIILKGILLCSLNELTILKSVPLFVD